MPYPPFRESVAPVTVTSLLPLRTSMPLVAEPTTLVSVMVVAVTPPPISIPSSRESRTEVPVIATFSAASRYSPMCIPENVVESIVPVEATMLDPVSANPPVRPLQKPRSLKAVWLVVTFPS